MSAARGAKMSLKERAEKLKTDIPALFLALKDRRTPAAAKVFAAITVVYALSPIDLIPDFIPVLGYLDDAILLPLLVALTLKFIPKDVFDDCRAKAADLWPGGSPAKWYYALPVLVFWAAAVLLVVKMVVK